MQYSGGGGGEGGVSPPRGVVEVPLVQDDARSDQEDITLETLGLEEKSLSFSLMYTVLVALPFH